MKTPQQLLQQTLKWANAQLPDASPGGRIAVPDRIHARSVGLGRARRALPRRALLGLAAGDVLGYLNACG